MSQNEKSLIKTLHILSAGLWLGASASVVLLQCLKGWSEDSRELSALNLNFSLLDYALIIPGAVGSLLTGFWICKRTNWGFLRYWWVIVKWISTLSGIVVGSALLGPWQMQMVKLSNLLVLSPAASLAYGQIRILFTLVGALQVLLLIFIIGISVRKPWGKRLVKQKEVKTLKQNAEGVL